MDVQQIISLAIVGVAAYYVAQQLLKQVQGKNDSCSGCGGACGKPVASGNVRPAPEATPLISLTTGPVRRRPSSTDIP